jgi:Ran GTPase-activating protein (RanGAP) involved in mRNA processing and transport
MLLVNEKLTDRDMDIVVNQGIVNKQCKELFLGWNKITSVGTSILAQVFNNNCKLEALYLVDNNVSDNGVYSLVKTLSTNNNTLKILSLGKNRITDEGAKHLAEIIKINQTLIHLWLDGNNISDEGARILISTIENFNSTLEDLHLSNNKLLTDCTADFLLQFMERNTSLKNLYVFDCNFSQPSKDKLKESQQSKPKFKIYVDSWCY